MEKKVNENVIEAIPVEETEKFEEEKSKALKPIEEQIANKLNVVISSIAQNLKKVETEEDYQRFLESLTAQDKAYRALLAFAGKTLDENDFVRFKVGDKVIMYLTHAGAEKIKAKLGINIQWLVDKPIKEWREDKRGKYYIYYIPAVAWHPQFGFVTYVGAASSRDLFFAKVGKEWKPIEDINEQHVMKKAVTNTIVLGVQHLLGLRNMSEEMVQKLFNWGKKAETVTFKTRKAAPKPEPSFDEKIKQELGLADFAAAQEVLQNMLFDLYGDKAGEELYKLCKKRTIKEIPQEKFIAVFKEIERRWKEKSKAGSPKEGLF